jgi:hypothetical protein
MTDTAIPVSTTEAPALVVTRSVQCHTVEFWWRGGPIEVRPLGWPRPAELIDPARLPRIAVNGEALGALVDAWLADPDNHFAADLAAGRFAPW